MMLEVKVTFFSPVLNALYEHTYLGTCVYKYLSLCTPLCVLYLHGLSTGKVVPDKIREKIHYLFSKDYCGLTLPYQFLDRFDFNIQKIHVPAKTIV